MNPSSQNAFPVVSMGKFTLLFFTTFGLYTLYWIYRNWAAVEQMTGRPMFKILRTVFSMFFIHDLFARIEKQNQMSEQPYRWSPSSKAWTFIFAGVIEFLLLQFGDRVGWIGPTFTLVMYLVTSVIYLYALYTAQLVINRMAGDPFGKTNQRLSGLNQLCVVIGMYIWFALFHSIYLEMTGQLPIPPAVETVQPVLDSGNAPNNTLEKGSALRI